MCVTGATSLPKTPSPLQTHRCERDGVVLRLKIISFRWDIVSGSRERKYTRRVETLLLSSERSRHRLRNRPIHIDMYIVTRTTGATNVVSGS